MSSVKLSSYPLKINGTDIPFPDSPVQEKFETLESVNESEAGTDIVQIRRLGKLNLSCSYQLMGSWAKFFENIYLTCHSKDMGFLCRSLCREINANARLFENSDKRFRKD